MLYRAAATRWQNYRRDGFAIASPPKAARRRRAERGETILHVNRDIIYDGGWASMAGVRDAHGQRPVRNAALTVSVKQVSNGTVGKRKRKLTGCSALLQTIVKSADYYCFCKQTNTVVRELYE